MKIGMLWFDNDPKADLETKLARAVDYYQRKYGLHPNLCYVHPTMLKTTPSRAASIEVRPNRQVLPNHIWLGVQEMPGG